MIKTISFRTMNWIQASGLFLAVVMMILIAQVGPALAGSSGTAGTVSAWGYNRDGQLGNGTTSSSAKPVAAIFPPGVAVSAIEAGAFHSLALTNDGVYAWGEAADVSGPTPVASPAPVKVIFPPEVNTISAISALGRHSLALTNDGVYAWGVNGSGQLGDGTNIDRWSPVKVVFPPEVTSVQMVSAGFYHSLAVTNAGLYTWGAGVPLGNGFLGNSAVPVKVVFPAAVTSIYAISGGGFHSLAITNDGLYAWGNNTFGQLGDGTTESRVVPVKAAFPGGVTSVTSISAGFYHSLAIAGNRAYGWGDNSNGVSGTSGSSVVPRMITFPKAVKTVSAIEAGDMHSLAITNDGLYAWGDNGSGQLGMQGGTRLTPEKVRSVTGVVAVGAGYYHTLALK